MFLSIYNIHKHTITMNDSTFTRATEAVLKRLAYYAHQLTLNSDDAEDLLQETLARAYINRDKFTDGSNFLCWTKRIMHNLYINKMDYSNRRPVICVYSYTDLCLRNEHCVQCHCGYDKDKIIQIIERLPVDYIVPMRMLVDGYRYSEIAMTLNLPISTVKNRIHTARASLKGSLEEFFK